MKRRKVIRGGIAPYQEYIEGILLGEQKTAEKTRARMRADIATLSRTDKKKADNLKRLYRRMRI